MILFLELTSHRRMRFESRLHIEVLPDLSAFVTRFADRRGWDTAMNDRLNAVAGGDAADAGAVEARSR